MKIKNLTKLIKVLYLTVILQICLETSSYAYLGLGPLIPLLGNAIVFLFGIFALIFGLLFYPVKTFLKKIKKKKLSDNK